MRRPDLKKDTKIGAPHKITIFFDYFFKSECVARI